MILNKEVEYRAAHGVERGIEVNPMKKVGWNPIKNKGQIEAQAGYLQP
jgi:hypothetical protein